MSFHAALIASGLRPHDVVADGRWHRCPTDDKPRRKNGCFLLAPCGTRGVWKNYALDEGWNKWQSDTVTAAQRLDSERRTREISQRDARRRVAAISAMRAHFNRLPPLRHGHPYLFDKGLSMLGCTGLRVDGDLLAIPMYLGSALMSMQTITPTGDKKYRYGCPIKGNAYVLARRRSVVTCLSEGFATGLAIYQSLPGASVVVCFDAGNMVHVARNLRVSGMAVVCADNDYETEARTGINTGIQRGMAAAEAIGCGVAYPQNIEGTDWADALKEWGGPARVRIEIMRQAKPVFARAA